MNLSHGKFDEFVAVIDNLSLFLASLSLPPFVLTPLEAQSREAGAAVKQAHHRATACKLLTLTTANPELISEHLLLSANLHLK